MLSDILAGKKVSAEIGISQKDRRQPKLKIALADGQTGTGSISARDLKLKIDVTDAPAGAQDVRLFRNGSLVKVWPGDVLKNQSSATLEATIPIVAGSNQITVYAFNRDNVKSTDAAIQVNGAESLKREGTLYIIAAGVNQYANAEYNLKYAVADARAFAEDIERQQRKTGAYNQIEAVTLFDYEATKANVLYALQWLRGNAEAALPQAIPSAIGKLKMAQPEDSVIVYYATERVPKMQEAKLRDARALKLKIAFVEGEEKIENPEERSVQRPRVFYRRETESRPLIVAKP